MDVREFDDAHAGQHYARLSAEMLSDIGLPEPAAMAAVRTHRGERRPADIEGWDGHTGERVAAVLAGVAEGELVEARA